MKLLNILITCIFFFKITYIYYELRVLYLQKKKQTNTQKYINMIYWRDHIEFLFICSMALLLIYLFRPGREKQLNNEEKMLLFLFGWVLLLTANWGEFFKDAKWINYV